MLREVKPAETAKTAARTAETTDEKALVDQAKGIREEEKCSRRAIPTGNGKPRKNPAGKMETIARIILLKKGCERNLSKNNGNRNESMRIMKKQATRNQPGKNFRAANLPEKRLPMPEEKRSAKRTTETA